MPTYKAATKRAALYDINDIKHISYSNLTRDKLSYKASLIPITGYGAPLDSPELLLKVFAPKLLAMRLFWFISAAFKSADLSDIFVPYLIFSYAEYLVLSKDLFLTSV
jgi:hypothetical protein